MASDSLRVYDHDVVVSIVGCDAFIRDNIPENEVVILVVNDRRYAPIGVVLRVRRRLLLVVEDVEVNGLIGETELLEDERDLPEMPAVAKLVRG